MRITADTLLSMTEKSFVREYLWTPEQQLAFLTARDHGVRYMDGSSSLTEDPRIPIDFHAELDQGGGSFVAAKSGIYGLAPQALTLYSWNKDGTRFRPVRAQELVLWQTGYDRKTVLARIPPSLGLQIDPRERWLSWISEHGHEEELEIFSRLRQDREVRSVLRVPGFLRNVRWHPDKAMMIYISWPLHDVPWESAKLYLADYDMQDLRPVPRPGRALQPPQLGTVPMSCSEAAFSPCGRYVIALLRTGEWYQFWSYEIAKQHWHQLSHAQAEHAKPPRGAEQPQFALHPHRPLVLGIAAEKGGSHFVHYHYAHDDYPQRWKAPRTRDSWLDQPRFSPDGRHLSVISASSQSLPGLRSWQYDVDTWYEANRVRLKQPYRAQSQTPLRVNWPSLDGETVHGLLYQPKDVNGPLPLIIAVHGGPVDQVSAGWPAKAKFFTQLGFAFLYVNYRGSWGYGSTYQRALAGRWGQIDAEDVSSAVTSLADQGFIDPTRVGLWGGAAGGMTVLNILIRFPRLIRSAVAVYPYLDLPDILQRCSPLKRAEFKWALGDCTRDEMLARSPLLRAGRIKTPLALFHGAQDKLVPLEQMHQLQNLLEKQGTAVQLKVYEHEGHGWKHETTRYDYARRVTDFFVKSLMESSSQPMTLQYGQREQPYQSL
jgi:dienelactone hydrolase